MLETLFLDLGGGYIFTLWNRIEQYIYVFCILLCVFYIINLEKEKTDFFFLFTNKNHYFVFIILFAQMEVTLGTKLRNFVE